MVRGTRVREVSAQQLADEVRVYSESGLDEPVGARLKQVRQAHRAREAGEYGGRTRQRDSTHMMHELVESLRALLIAYEPGEHE